MSLAQGHNTPIDQPLVAAKISPDTSGQMIAQALHALSEEGHADEASSSITVLIKAIHADPRQGTRRLSAALLKYPNGAQRLIECLERNPTATREIFERLAPSEAAALLQQLNVQDPVESERLYELIKRENPRQAQELYMSFSNGNRGGYVTDRLNLGPYHSGDAITLESGAQPSQTYKFLR